jgi:glycosyltransferase involved in cell wall biosynthesis
MSTPFFSIIIPTHMRSSLLRRVLESVRSNGFEDYELVVVSDVGDADTMKVAAELLRDTDTFVKRSGPPGPALSRNIGMGFARGHRTIFLDDDDSLMAGYLQTARDACEKHVKDILYTNFTIVEEDRTQAEIKPLKVTEYSVQGVAPSSVYVKNFIHNHTAIFPSAVLRGKLQDPHLSSLDDWDFLLNAIQDAELRHLDMRGPVIHKDYVNTGNRRGSSGAANDAKVLSDYLSIYKKWPAPTPELKQQRRDLLASAGLQAPLEWL